MDCKEDTHTNSHTFRYRDQSWGPGKRDLLERDTYGSQAALTSDIDQLIEEHYPKGHRRGNVSLNNPALWDDMVAKLEETAKTCFTEMDSYGSRVTKYLVPATQLQDTFVPKRARRASDEFDEHTESSERRGAKWNGDYYDDTIIYQYSGNDSDTVGLLTKICPINAQGAILDNPRAKRITYGFFNPEQGSSYDYDGVSCRVNCTREKRGVIEFNFESPQHVTHIGTLGRIPRTRSFPKNMNRQGVAHYRSWKKQQKGSLRVCTSDNPVAYVTSYEVHCKNSEGRWIYHGIFEGNTDIQTEKVNLFDITTRGLRIKPVGYAGDKPAMRIALYAEEDVSSKKNATEYIEYSIVHPRQQAYVPEGKHGYPTSLCKQCGDYECHTKHRRPNTTKQYLKEIARDTPNALDFVDVTDVDQEKNSSDCSDSEQDEESYFKDPRRYIQHAHNCEYKTSSCNCVPKYWII